MIYTVLLLLFVGALAEPDCKLPPPISFMEICSCCEVPDLFEEFKSSMATKCPFPENQPKGFPSPEKMCHLECTFNESGIMENGVINMEKSKEVVKKMLKDKELHSVFENAIETCVPRAVGKLEKKPEGLPKPKCTPLPMMLMFCTKREVFLNCPDSKWNKKENKNCDEARDYMKACPDGWKLQFENKKPGGPVSN